MTIVLKDGYVIETDPMNFTLKKIGCGTRNGQECETVKLTKHYSTIEGALQKFIRLMRVDGKDDVVVEFEEYLRMVQELDEKNRVFLEGFMKGVNFEKR